MTYDKFSLFYFRPLQSSRALVTTSLISLCCKFIICSYGFSSFFTTVRLARSLMFVFKLDFSSFCWAFLIFQLDTPSSSLPRAQRDGPNFTLVYGKSFLSDFSFMLFFLFLVFILCIFLVTFSTEMKSKLLIHYSYAFVVVVCLAQKSSIKIVLLLCDLINGFFSYSGTISSLFL